MKRLIIVLTVVFLNLHVSSSVQAQQPTYRITDLGTLGGYTSEAMSINNAGQVVGYSPNNDGDERSFFYDGSTMIDIGTLGGSVSRAYDINNSGLVTGYSTTSGSSGFNAFIYNGSSMINLGNLGSLPSQGGGINDSGQVTGWSRDSNNEPRAFLYDNGAMTDLGTLGGPYSLGRDINNSGQIVGTSALPGGSGQDGYDHAFLWENGVMSDIGTLGGSWSASWAINDMGQIVGYSPTLTSNGIGHAFLSDGSDMFDLGTLGGAGSTAFDINEDGFVVGWSMTDRPVNDTAFLYTPNDGMLDLFSLVVQGNSDWVGLTAAFGINDLGQIVGKGGKLTEIDLGSGPEILAFPHAFLLTPVPIPAAGWLLMSGLVGIVGFGRKKRS